MRIDSKATAVTALGFVAALMFSAPTALADPALADPVPAVHPRSRACGPSRPPRRSPFPHLRLRPPWRPRPYPPSCRRLHLPWRRPTRRFPHLRPRLGPAPDGTVQAAAADPAAPPDGMPHLSSPENLPPGTTDTPPDAGQPRTLGYLRDLWHAVQTQDVSGRDALLLLTQRPMNADAVPPPGMPANPTPPTPPLPPLPPEPAPTP